ncbi:hypothetical protein A9Q99_11655 [Gammaproteobacteria bacterium 45_16_T64]|nr:hypothetical protein A9Q99_11655 [Gammaproteobacteria bacterium 45_16_T64]
MSTLTFTIPYYDSAFEEGCSITRDEGRFDMRVKSAGDIIISSGELIGADPFILVGDAPFVQTVPVGTFPVRLAVAKIDDDERVALARIDFATDTVVQWEMALLPEQDPDALEEDEIYGFTTDAGAACFMDKDSSAALKNEIRDGSDFFEELMEEMDENFESTWAWANMELETGNIVSFMSGYGNGYYATYFGKNAAGDVVAVVTDFDVLPWHGAGC